jgi:hypothetical protein
MLIDLLSIVCCRKPVTSVHRLLSIQPAFEHAPAGLGGFLAAKTGDAAAAATVNSVPVAWSSPLWQVYDWHALHSIQGRYCC